MSIRLVSIIVLVMVCATVVFAATVVKDQCNDGSSFSLRFMVKANLLSVTIPCE